MKYEIDFGKIISAIFQGAAIAILSTGVKSMQSLNTRMAIVIDNVGRHNKALEDHEVRLRSVESIRRR